eukprot:TRINITY_DN9226_c0_g1_i14.p1 TRINITY_DN9226_c0_g1~~TRINITY_DN9226_c0_g1_i14.p1  ORF type:complete len:584 (-),score=94.77 TRINITY_DN9226_c0_g1_i14:64-1815(-)
MGNRSFTSSSSSRPGNDLNVPAQPTGVSQKQNSEKGDEDIRDKYELGQVLGSGSFGQVREARLRACPDRIRAAKIVEKDEGPIADGEWSNSAMFRQEVALLQNLEHDNIVRFWDVYEDIHFLYVVMDICRGGEVFTKIIELKRFTETHAATLGSQMLAAIEYIHGKSIMHRDLKAENFLLADSSPTSKVKMIDFGMAVKFEPGVFLTSLCGSPHYLAPEVIGQQYDHRADMWAFGVLMFLMMFGQYPYDAKSHRDIMLKVIGGPPRFQRRTKIDPKTLDFLQGCLQRSRRKRLSATAALQHSFIASAAEPAEGPRQEACGTDLTEEVRSALQHLSTSRRPADMEADSRRTLKLGEMEKSFLNGVRQGQRLGQTPQEDFMTKPEFVRRDNRLTTAPSAAVNKLMAKMARGKDAIVNKVADRSSRKVQNMRQDEYTDLNASDKLEPSANGRVVASVPDSRRKERVQSERLMYMKDFTVRDEADMRKAWSRWRQESEEGHRDSQNSNRFDSGEFVEKAATGEDASKKEQVVKDDDSAEQVGKVDKRRKLRDARGGRKKSSGPSTASASQFDNLLPITQAIPHTLPS